MVKRRGLSAFIYRHRLVGKRAVVLLNWILPRTLSRPITTLAERVSFWMTPDYQGDTLPPIFHYWSQKYLAPQLVQVGLSSPEDLYYRETRKYADSTDFSGPVSILSLGSGAADLELALLDKLRGDGIESRVECVDFNTRLKDIAVRNARTKGSSEHFKFTVRDCNSLETAELRDVIIVNQFFHHVENLDALCTAIKMQLKPNGVLLTSDVIGRNGHVLWPTVNKYVQDAWSKLAPRQRFDRYFSAEQSIYVSVDHSSYSNEGICAQDVVPKLLEHFDFELFISYGARIIPFIERRIGFNFSIESEEDRNFIDELSRADQASLHSSEYPASNLVAILRHKGKVKESIFVPMSPGEHVMLTSKEKTIEQTRQQIRRIAGNLTR